MKNLKKVLLIFMPIFVLFIVKIAKAQIALEVPIPGMGGGVAGIGEYIQKLYNYGIYAGSVMAVIMISISGFKWVAAGGNKSSIEKAKSGMVMSITGLFLLFGSYVILNTVNSKLTVLGALDVEPIIAKKVDITGGGCKEDKDCKDEKICIAGTCQKIREYGEPCYDNKDCKAGLYCLEINVSGNKNLICMSKPGTNVCNNTIGGEPCVIPNTNQHGYCGDPSSGSGLVCEPCFVHLRECNNADPCPNRDGVCGKGVNGKKCEQVGGDFLFGVWVNGNMKKCAYEDEDF